METFVQLQGNYQLGLVSDRWLLQARKRDGRSSAVQGKKLHPGSRVASIPVPVTRLIVIGRTLDLIVPEEERTNH